MVYNKTQMLSAVRPLAGEVQSLGDSLLVPFLGFPRCAFIILVLKYRALTCIEVSSFTKPHELHVPLLDRCCSKCARVAFPTWEPGSYRSSPCTVTAKPCCLLSGSSCQPRTSPGSAFTPSHCSEHLCWHDLRSSPGPFISSHELYSLLYSWYLLLTTILRNTRKSKHISPWLWDLVFFHWPQTPDDD